LAVLRSAREDALGFDPRFFGELGYFDPNGRAWPIDRVLAEANLDLNRFLEPHLGSMKKIPWVTRREFSDKSVGTSIFSKRFIKPPFCLGGNLTTAC
jgi:hypothetical protein